MTDRRCSSLAARAISRMAASASFALRSESEKLEFYVEYCFTRLLKANLRVFFLVLLIPYLVSSKHDLNQSSFTSTHTYIAYIHIFTSIPSDEEYY